MCGNRLLGTPQRNTFTHAHHSMRNTCVCLCLQYFLCYIVISQNQLRGISDDFIIPRVAWIVVLVWYSKFYSSNDEDAATQLCNHMCASTSENEDTATQLCNHMCRILHMTPPENEDTAKHGRNHRCASASKNTDTATPFCNHMCGVLQIPPPEARTSSAGRSGNRQ